MPIFTGIVAAIVSAVGLTGFAAAAATFVLRTLAISVVSSLIGRALSPSQNSSGQDPGGRVQLPPATNNKLPVSYGDAYLSPVMFDAKLSQKQQYMWYVGAISETTDTGVITFDDPSNAGFPLAYWGDRKLNFNATNKTQVDSSTGPNGDVITYAANTFNVYFYNNGSNSPLYGADDAITVLSDATTDGGIPEPQRWTNNNTMTKTAFCIIRMKYNVDKSLTGLQQVIVFAKNTLNKPGSVMLDYLKNTRYGCGIPQSAIDTAAFVALDAYSDQNITFTTSGGTSSTQPRYRINGPVSTAENVLSNLQKLAESCDSWLQWNEANAQWSIIINRSIEQSGLTPANLFVINDSNIIGGINITPLDTASTYNRYEVRFPSKLIKDQTDYAFLDLTNNATLNPNNKFRIAANEPDSVLTIELPQVNDSVQAQYIANRRLLQSRDDLIITVTTDYSGIQCNAGDIVRVYHEWYGWDALNNGNGKYFRVTQVQEALSADGILGASLTLVEFNNTIYDDNSVRAFAPAQNTGIIDPTILTTPAAPTISNINTTASSPSFQVNAIIPATGTGSNTGTVLAIEFWYSISQDIINNNYLLYDTQYYSGIDNLYPPGVSENIVVGGLPAGSYYWRVRTRGPNNNTSDFSSASAIINWSPNPVVSVVGQTFQAAFSPQVLQVPRTNTGNTDLSQIVLRLYGLVGGGAVEFVDAQTDSANTFVNNSWRIGSDANTGYGSITTTNLTIGNPSDGGKFALWPSPTAMSNSPAYVNVPVRYKDNTGNITQSGVASTQLVFANQGANGATGNNGYTTIVNRIYIVADNTVSAGDITTVGGAYNVSTGVWQTRPTTQVKGITVTNYDRPVSFTNTQLRWVITSTIAVSNTIGAVITPLWNAAEIDSGYGPAGQNGQSPVDFQLSLGSGGFYRSDNGSYSPIAITITAFVRNYTPPVPPTEWTVIGGTPYSSTGISITVTPEEGATEVSVTAQVGPYIKNVIIPIVDQGRIGPAGPQGVQGSQGTRGFNPVVYIPVNFDPSTSSNTQRTQAYQQQTGYQPIDGDGAAFFWTGAGAPIPNVSYAYRFVGLTATWVPFEYYIPGDLLAAGTVRATSLSTYDVFTNRLASINSQFGSNSSSGFWLDSQTGNARFGGSISIGGNLDVAGLITSSGLNANTVVTENLVTGAVSAPIVTAQPSGPIYFTTPPQVNVPQIVTSLPNVYIGSGETIIIGATSTYTLDIGWTATSGNRFVQIEDELKIYDASNNYTTLSRHQINLSRVDFTSNSFTRIGDSTHNWVFTNGSGINQNYRIEHSYNLSATYNNPSWNRYYAEYRAITVYRIKR